MLEPAEQDHIAETILTESPLAVIRARLANADADFAAENTVENSDALWRARFDRLQATIAF